MFSIAPDKGPTTYNALPFLSKHPDIMTAEQQVRLFEQRKPVSEFFKKIHWDSLNAKIQPLFEETDTSLTIHVVGEYHYSLFDSKSPEILTSQKNVYLYLIKNKDILTGFEGFPKGFLDKEKALVRTGNVLNYDNKSNTLYFTRAKTSEAEAQFDKYVQIDAGCRLLSKGYTFVGVEDLALQNAQKSLIMMPYNFCIPNSKAFTDWSQIEQSTRQYLWKIRTFVYIANMREQMKAKGVHEAILVVGRDHLKYLDGITGVKIDKIYL